MELKPIKTKFLSLKPLIKACVGDNSAECIETREKMAEQSRIYLRELVTLLEKSLEKVKNKVVASEDLT